MNFSYFHIVFVVLIRKGERVSKLGQYYLYGCKNSKTNG